MSFAPQVRSKPWIRPLLVSNDQLRRVELFTDLNDPSLDELKALAEPWEAAPGETLVTESSQGEELFAIAKGRVEIFLSLPGGSQSESIAILGEGEVLGESTLVGKARRIATAVAKDDVLVLKWRKSDLLTLFEQEPAIGYRFMYALAKMVHERLTSTNMNLRNALNQILR